MKRQRFNFKKRTRIPKLSPKLIPILIVIFLIICFVVGLGYILRQLDFFKIKEVILKKDVRADLSYLKGQNIFTLDLSKESRYILQSYPTYKKIRLVRILPDRLFVDFVKRVALAQVKLYRYFCVDEDAVLFDGELQEELPLIVGLETKIFGPKLGRKYNVKELELALNIIKEIRRNRILKKCSIKKIDVTTTSNAAFFLPLPAKAQGQVKVKKVASPAAIEIKIGEDRLRDKVNFLSTLLVQVRKDLANIKYIDLRFKEPVIKFNDVNK
ncbi:MAG: hypothetical protein HZA27_01055 [Candidatus Omnitrophica bacterium]|nr:hypothetical protein [Candidatus Omnitrophota bacterium]MBI5144755.1 hypothetical protein [Candidatus Omnitrophota bacterium]